MNLLLCSIGQILAIMRQWVPQTQHAINTLVLEVLKRGAHPDDRSSKSTINCIEKYIVERKNICSGEEKIRCIDINL
jgi:hypothetical protein